MACKIEEEFNPWPSFVDIFSSVILVLLLFLLVVLANLGYYAQFKYKVSYTGSITSSELIASPSSSTPAVSSASSSSEVKSNSDLNIQIIKEQKQMILTLQNQIAVDPTAIKSAVGSDEVDSAGINVANKPADSTELQKTIAADEYLVITYKADELFVDDAVSKQLKDFLNKAKTKYASHGVYIYSSDTKTQLSATIAKQISLARTMSVRNLIRKFGYEKKDIKIDLSNVPEIKETVDAKNGYVIIKIEK
jgi:hypothetical protein